MRIAISLEDTPDLIQIDRSDIWNMDYTLARVILPMLHVLKINKQGVPGDLVPDCTKPTDQMDFDFIDEEVEEDRAHEIACKRWDMIIDQMIWSFGEIEANRMLDVEYGQNYPGGMTAYFADIQVGLNHFGKYYTSLWD